MEKIKAHMWRNRHYYWLPIVAIAIMWGSLWAGYIIYRVNPDQRADLDSIGTLAAQGLVVIFLTVISERLLLWDFENQRDWNMESWQARFTQGLLRVLLIFSWIWLWRANH